MMDQLHQARQEVHEAMSFSKQLLKEHEEKGAALGLENKQLLDDIQEETTRRREAEAALVALQREKEDTAIANRRFEQEVARLRFGISQSAAMMGDLLDPRSLPGRESPRKEP